MQQLKQLSYDLFSLLFPNLCNGCGRSLFPGEKAICSHCLHDLPFTDFHVNPANQVAKQFWLRVPITAAMAMLYFKKGGKVQQIIHNLKYRGKTDLGFFLGTMLGNRLKGILDYQQADYIIPVPLHHSRKRQRGYNQCDEIARGLSAALQVPVGEYMLIRKKITSTQTRKSRFLRYENMMEVFEVLQKYSVVNQHILLIDDVVTTGATLEACTLALLAAGAKKISIACVAFSQ